MVFILCAVPAQILIPAAHLEDVTEGGLPLTQARTSSGAMREHALQRSLELSLRVALMPSLAHRPRESPSSATQSSTKSDTQVAQLPCNSRALIHLMLDPLQSQLCMSSPATTHSPRLTRARERSVAGWSPVIHKSCTSIPSFSPACPFPLLKSHELELFTLQVTANGGGSGCMLREAQDTHNSQ